MTKLSYLSLILMVGLLLVAGCQNKQTKTTPSKIEAVQSPVPAVKAKAVDTEQQKQNTPEPQARIKSEEPNETQKPAPVQKAPKEKPKEAKQSKAELFNSSCVVILNPEFINDKGIADYNLLKRNKSELKKLLDNFATLSPKKYESWPKDEKIAFWLNAYNIKLLDIIAENHPIQSTRIRRLFWPPASIRHITGIWSDYKFIVTNEEFTLSEVDKRYFRSEFDDPKIFFAISQASLSGPALRNQPFTGEKLQSQLEDQVKRFLSRTDVFKIDRTKKTVSLSALFQPSWYGTGFVPLYGTDKKFKEQEPAARAVLNFITNYISPEDKAFLETENYTVNYITYDWSLNQ